jgi:tetratricopeptide (TPR) repeat protein
MEMSIVNAVIASLYDYTGQPRLAIKYYQQVAVTNQYLSSAADLMMLNNYLVLDDYISLNSLLNKIALNNHLNAKQTLLFKATYYIGVLQYQRAYDLLWGQYNTYHSDPNYLYQLASMSATLKKTEQAIKLYKDYIKLNSKDPYGYNDLAYVYADQTHDYKKALEYARRAFEMEPMDPTIADTYGWVYYKLGNFKVAYVYIKNSYDATQDPNTAEHLKMVYLALKRSDLASSVVTVTLAQQQEQAKQNLIDKTLNLLMYLQYGVSIK